MSQQIKILERETAKELEEAVNELIEEGWNIAGNNYQVKPETFWDDASYSIILLGAPHVPANPQTIALYEDDNESQS